VVQNWERGDGTPSQGVILAWVEELEQQQGLQIVVMIFIVFVTEISVLFISTQQVKHYWWYRFFLFYLTGKALLVIQL